MSESVPSDRQLLEQARAGDSGAFDRLVGRYGNLVLSVARSVTRDPTEAEDVAQEAFLRFYRNLDKVDPERPLEAWLVRVTLNAARSHVSRSPARREDGLDETERVGSSRGNPQEALEAADMRGVLLEATAALSVREREVFLLRDVQGLPSVTIGDALGIAPVTVRRLSANAKRKVVTWVRTHRPDLARLLGG